MTPFTVMTATAAPLLRANIDTDAIIPSREITGTGKTGLADGLFAGWRYLNVAERTPDPDFVLNRSPFRDARILLAGENVGCGSSREHAVWALVEYGFRAVVAPSFNAIFRGNCVRNGVAPVVLATTAVERLAAIAEAAPLTIDLERQEVRAAGEVFGFAIDDEARQMLLGGLDLIDLTLARADEITAFRDADRAVRPWVYLS